MAETLSIRERIELRLLEVLQAVAGVSSGNAQRVSMHENRPVLDPETSGMPAAWLLLDAESEAWSANVGGYYDVTAQYQVEVHITHPRDEGATMSLSNEWVARVVKALLTDIHLTDSDAILLADDLRVTGTTPLYDLDPEAGEVVAQIQLEVDYRFVDSDPYALTT